MRINHQMRPNCDQKVAFLLYLCFIAPITSKPLLMMKAFDFKVDKNLLYLFDVMIVPCHNTT